REVEGAAGLVHWHAVDEDLGVVALSSADEDRGLASERPRACYGHSGNFAKSIGDIDYSASAEVGTVQDSDAGGDVTDGKWVSCGCDDDGFEFGCVLHRL